MAGLVFRKQQEPIAQSQQESIPQYIGRNVGRTGVQALTSLAGLPGDILSGITGLGNLLETGASALTGRQPALAQQPSIPGSQQLQQAAQPYLPEGLLQPRGTGEEFISRIAQDLPQYLALGALTGGAAPLGQAAKIVGAGAAGSQAAKELGFGPLGEFAGGALGSLGAGIRQRGGSPGQLRKVAKNEYTKDYAQAEKIAPSLSQKAPDLNTFVEKELSKLYEGTTGLSRPEEREAIKQLIRVDNALSNNTINVKKAWDLKKHFNQLLKKSEDSDLRKIYSRTVGSLNDVLSQASESHPEFGKSFTRAEQLFQAVEAPNKLRKIIEDNTRLSDLLTNPLAKLGLLGGAYSLKGAKGLGLTIPTTLTARYGLRAYDFFKRPEARQLASQIYKDAVADNTKALAVNIKRLNDQAEQFEKQQSPQKGGRLVYRRAS